MRRPSYVRWLFAIGVLVLSCYGDGVRHCPTVDCPVGMVCDGHDGCALQAQIDVCRGMDDLTPCSFAGVSNGVCQAEVCRLAFCGDGLIDQAFETCDDGAANALTPGACRPNCVLPRCGDSVKDGSEVCDDGNNVSGDGCSSDCSSTESCGNGVVDQGEQCEAGMLGGKSCTDVNFYGGTLGCGGTCQFDTSQCVGRCGDGIKNGTEDCDTNQFGGKTCGTYNFQTGTLTCTTNCSITTTNCHGTCGDGACLNGETCTTCAADCTIGSLGGSCCGNFICESGEDNSTCPMDCTTFTYTWP